MAVIPLLRVIVFSFSGLLSLVVLGICAHILWVVTQVYGRYPPLYASLGTATSAITAVSLPLFLILGRSKTRVFTSMVLFEIIWFFILWILWGATVGITVVVRGWFFRRCVRRLCYEAAMMEVSAFLIFFAAFIYYDVLFLYAIIHAIRGRNIWTLSVWEAVDSGAITPAVPMNQAQCLQQFAPQYDVQYPGAPAHAPLPYYPQQAPLLGQPYPPLAASSLAPQHVGQNLPTTARCAACNADTANAMPLLPQICA